jgi:hypothetical protein
MPEGRHTRDVNRDPVSVGGFGLAVVLVTAPFWMLPHAGAASTTYVAERIEYGVGIGIEASGPVEGVDCYEKTSTRGCLFARRVAREGPVTVDVGGSLSPAGFTDASFVAVGTDPPFRRVRVSRPEGTEEGVVRYNLDPVEAETVLEEVSVDEQRVPAELRSTLDGEAATVYGRTVDVEGKVARVDGEYYRLTVVDRSRPGWTANRALVTVVRAVPFVVGLGLLRRRWRG